MLVFNLDRLFKLRGISFPMKHLTQQGLSKSTAYRLTARDFERISAGDIEMLCKCFNDLMEWKPDNAQEDLPNNPMFALKRNESKFDISSIVKDVPVEKLEELQKEILRAVEKAKGR
jgi:hypothetical protein